MLEIRNTDSALELGEDEMFYGTPIVFNQLSKRFGNARFDYELILPGAATKTLQENKELFLLANHNWDMPLATTTNNSLVVTQDNKAVSIRAKLSDTSYAKDYAALVKDGTIKGMSFGFKAVRDTIEVRDGVRVRIVSELKLFEFSLTPMPAYNGTKADIRTAALLEELEVELRSGRFLTETSAEQLKDSIRRIEDLLTTLKPIDTVTSDIQDRGLAVDVAQAMLEIRRRKTVK